MTTNTLRNVLMAALVLPLACDIPACCQQDDPAQAVTLSNASYQGCDSHRGLNRPVATGARLDIRAERDGTQLTVERVELSADGVFEVIDPGNPVGLRGVAPGDVNVQVVAENGSATVNLEVADIASAAVVPDGLTLFNLTTALEAVEPSDLEQVAAAGVGILPDGKVRLHLHLADAQGRDLMGYGVADWQVEPAGLVDLEPAEERSDDVDVRPTGQVGDVTLTSVAGGSYLLSTVASGAAETMVLYSPDTREVFESLTMVEGDSLTVVVVPYDADGRFLVGADDAVFAVTAGGGAAVVVDPPWATPEGDVELDDAGRQLLEDARVVYLRAESVGTATLHVEAVGLSRDFPVEVVEE